MADKEPEVQKAFYKRILGALKVPIGITLLVISGPMYKCLMYRGLVPQKESVGEAYKLRIRYRFLAKGDLSKGRFVQEDGEDDTIGFKHDDEALFMSVTKGSSIKHYFRLNTPAGQYLYIDVQNLLSWKRHLYFMLWLLTSIAIVAVLSLGVLPGALEIAGETVGRLLNFAGNIARDTTAIEPLVQ